MDRRREREWGNNRDRERERDRDKGRDRDRDGHRDRDRDSDRDRDRNRARDRGRSRSPRHDRHRKSGSPTDRHGDRGRRSISLEARRDARARERSRDRGNESMDIERADRKGIDKREEVALNGSEGHRAAIVAEFVDGIAREQEQLPAGHSQTQTAALQPPFAVPAAQSNEEDMMKKFGIPVGFSTSKGKYVADANHSAVKLTSKRTPRQYMNRRGGFNRPLPAETNR